MGEKVHWRATKKYSLIHTASLPRQTGDTTLLNSTSLFSLDTETEFMTKLWTNQEAVLLMTWGKKLSVIFLSCVHKLLGGKKKHVRSKHFALNVGVSVSVLWTEQ